MPSELTRPAQPGTVEWVMCCGGIHDDMDLLETLGVAVSIRGLGLSYQGRPVTHMDVRLHRYVMAPIIRSHTWSSSQVLVGPGAREGDDEKRRMRRSMAARLRRRIERYLEAMTPPDPHAAAAADALRAEYGLGPSLSSERYPHVTLYAHGQGGWLLYFDALSWGMTSVFGAEEVATRHEESGDAAARSGAYAAAAEAYRRAVAVRTRGAWAEYPDDRDQRDLGSVRVKLGDVLAAQSDFAAALVEYREGLAIAKRVTLTGPVPRPSDILLAMRRIPVAECVETIALASGRVIDTLQRLGDTAGVVETARDCVAFVEHLATLDPADPDIARGLETARRMSAGVTTPNGLADRR